MKLLARRSKKFIVLRKDAGNTHIGDHHYAGVGPVETIEVHTSYAQAEGRTQRLQILEGDEAQQPTPGAVGLAWPVCKA